MQNNHVSEYFVKRSACPACLSRHFSTIYSCEYLQDPVRAFLEAFYNKQGFVELHYLENGVYTVAECESCGLIFQQYIPDDVLAERIYEHWIDPEVSFQKAEKNKINAHHLQEVAIIREYLDPVNPSELTFFDYGMGWGKWCQAAKSIGCQVYGAELSRNRIANAERLGVEVLEWEQIPQKKFDFINTDQVIEHVPDPLGTIRHLAKALKPKGLLKINVPNGIGIKQKLRFNNWKRSHGVTSLNAILPLEHINCFKHQQIIKMGKLAGLVPVKIPIKIQYAIIMRTPTPKKTLRNLINPLYRNYVSISTYCFFAKQ